MTTKDQTAKQKRSESALPSEKQGTARVAISEEGKIVYASEAFCALSHIDPEKALALDALDVLKLPGAAETLEALEAGVHKVQLNGHEDTLEFHFDWLTAPDQRRYLIASRAPDHAGTRPRPSDTQFKNYILKTLENTEAGRQADFEPFFSLSEDIMAVLDLKGEILRANAAFRAQFGEPARQTVFTDLFDEDEKPHIRNLLQNLNPQRRDKSNNAKSSAVNFETGQDLKSIKGWIEWRMRRKGDYIYVAGSDVSAIKGQKEALKKHEKQLSRAESLAGMGHWQWQVGRDEIEWSKELYQIFGVKPEEFTPTLESMSTLVHRRDVDRVNHVFQRALLGQNSYEVEFRINRPDGETRYIRCEGRCAANDEEGATGLYGIMQDMTERRLYEQQLRAAKDTAERAYAAKSQFLANMSHELRTPLNAIIGFSEMMQRQLLGPLGNEKYVEYITGIRESGEHLLDLISDILDMSKIEAGKYELELQDLNVAKTLRMAVHMIENRALENGVRISTKALTDKKLKIIADRRAFLQIMLNLLSNAVKFSREAGDVRIECHKREDYIALKVIDNGIGIPANKLARITRPFEQASTSYAREHEGSGLGLAITKELTELHGGALHIESSVDIGTTVTVRLPYDASKHAQSA